MAEFQITVPASGYRWYVVEALDEDEALEIFHDGGLDPVDEEFYDDNSEVIVTRAPEVERKRK